MAAPRTFALLTCLVACGARPPAKDVVSTDDPAIARVEHGLVPERRVVGVRPWSIEERMRAHHTPAVSIAVIHDHRVVWARAYGVRDLGSGARAETTTPFQAASISKMVTALGALRLAEGRKVSLDTNVNDTLRVWKLPENELTRATPVTLRMLLAHTGGTNLHSVSGYPPDTTLPTLPQILDGLPPSRTAAVRVVHPPGKEFHYSGGGSMVVQQLMVDATGQSFATALDDLVLHPLGMDHATFAVPPPREVRTRASEAHDVDGTVLPDTVYPESAPAGLWATPTDIARFLAEIQLGRQGRSRVVSRDAAAKMTTPVAPIGVPDVSTGLGTFVENRNGTLYFGHDGHNDGALSMARATVDGGDGAVVMANSASAAPLILEIMRSIAVAYEWKGWLKEPIRPVPIAEERLAALAGRYSAGVDDDAIVAVRGPHLELRTPFRIPIVLYPTGADDFASDDDVRYHFHHEADRRSVTMTAAGDPPRELVARDGETSPLELVASGAHDRAMTRYRALREARPADPAIAEARFDELAMELYERRLDCEGAARIFRVQAALYPASTRAHAGAALALLCLGRPAEAEAFYRQTVALDAARKKGSEIEEIYLGVRLARLKQRAALRWPSQR